MNVHLLSSIAILLGSATVTLGADPAALSREEAASGWRSLFDGKSLRGWSAEAGNWKVEDGAVIGAGAGGSLTYVMYRLGRDYELRVHWKEKSAGEWNTERIVCHGKVVEHSLNGAPLAGSKKSRVDAGGCGEFLKFPDPGGAIVYKGIYLRTLLPPSSPALFEEDMMVSMQLRIKLWKQMEAYADALPPRKHSASTGASLIERFREENGYPPPDGKGHAKAKLEKIGDDAVATYYRCYVPVTSQMDAGSVANVVGWRLLG